MRLFLSFFLLSLLCSAGVHAQNFYKNLRREVRGEDCGFDWYKIRSTNDYRYGAESANGETLIPMSRGYEFIMFSCVENHTGFFSVEKNGKNGVCDIDGKEIIAPRYESTIIFSSTTDGFEYKDANGKWQSLGYTLDANGRGVRTGTSSSSESVASSGVGHTLLYRGVYWVCGAYGDVEGNVTIYTDYLVMEGSSFPLKEVRSNGNRVYDIGSGVEFVVDGNYNIRREHSAYDCMFRKKNSGGGYNGGYNNGYNGGYTPTSPSNSGTTTNPVQPHQQTKSCSLCQGSGKCANCNGKGWHYGYGGSTVDCSNCSRTGRCPSCGGSGKKTSTSYY